MTDHWDMMRLQSWAEYFGTFLDDGPKIFFPLFRLLYCWPAQKWLLQTAFTVNKLLQVTVEEGQPGSPNTLASLSRQVIFQTGPLCVHMKKQQIYYACLFSDYFLCILGGWYCRRPDSWVLSDMGWRMDGLEYSKDSSRLTLYFLRPEKNQFNTIELNLYKFDINQYLWYRISNIYIYYEIYFCSICICCYRCVYVFL